MTRTRRTRTAAAEAGTDPTDGGSAVIDFAFLAVLLAVPMVYLIVTVARIQAASYAVAQAAREAARVVVTTPSGAEPLARARTAAALAFEDQGFPAPDGAVAAGTVNASGPGTIQLDCGGAACLQPQNTVTLTATISVDLPLVPAAISQVVPMRLPVSATHRLVVDRFRSGP
ncbi:MAG TPA: pilus assembly protein [Dermatophilaceae bacterium]|nr:pilus assembly protein [Dermatophilaceae bacterium]